jgi:hypothetical protein
VNWSFKERVLIQKDIEQIRFGLDQVQWERIQGLNESKEIPSLSAQLLISKRARQLTDRLTEIKMNVLRITSCNILSGILQKEGGGNCK